VRSSTIGQNNLIGLLLGEHRVLVNECLRSRILPAQKVKISGGLSFSKRNCQSTSWFISI